MRADAAVYEPARVSVPSVLEPTAQRRCRISAPAAARAEGRVRERLPRSGSSGEKTRTGAFHTQRWVSAHFIPFPAIPWALFCSGI